MPRSGGRWADQEKQRILERAYNQELGYFTQAFEGTFPDASNLLLPTLGIVEPTDPRFVSTVRAYERLLVDNGLMLRYRHADDFGETTSAFSICSFWWVEALAMMGEVDNAVSLFNRLLGHANPLGLFSEDIDPHTGRLLGNFPQAYTHVGLIHAGDHDRRDPRGAQRRTSAPGRRRERPRQLHSSECKVQSCACCWSSIAPE